jgi:hypothetical protein
MNPTDWDALWLLVFVAACLWFWSMFRILIRRIEDMVAELRGINAKLGKIETRSADT